MAELADRDAALLLDMLLAARDAQEFVKGLSEAAFGASRLRLDGYGLGEKVYEINFQAGRLARGVADRSSTPDKPRFVACAERTPDHSSGKGPAAWCHDRHTAAVGE